MKSKPRHKFGAVRTEVDGRKFDSKAEARFAAKLDKMQEAGEVLFYLRQTRFDLPGGIFYKADFTVFFSDGRTEFVDVKGIETQEFKLKRKLLESTYPIELQVVKC